MRRMHRSMPIALQDGAAVTAPLSADFLFRQYARYVAHIALRIVGRDADVDEIVQDVFLAAMSGLADLREPEAVRGWLATITVRKAQRRLRYNRLQSWLGLEDEPDYEGAVAPNASPEDQAVVRSVYRALDSVPVNDRVAWTLRYMQDERLESVAALIGCSLATAKRRIAAAQLKLDEVLKDD